MAAKTDYRPDIDGLRAVAVLSVIFYHAGFKLFSGGYVGVDVFFVISGYLITKIILTEIRENNFTLTKFYERRIRRIYPAAFAVMAFVLLISAIIYSASDYINITKSIVSTTFFFSNILFWTESGYFETPSTLKPLLHTWSLSVEEQFYILFPLLLIIFSSLTKFRLRSSIAVIALISFAANIFFTFHYESVAFYFMPLRAWEMLAGSMLVMVDIPQSAKAAHRNILSLAGITLILASVLMFDEETFFPGFAALIPVAGSAIIIYSGMSGRSFIGNILSLKPVVFIGKISYSLYLWHWPLLVIGKYYIIRQLILFDIIIWLTITFAISTLSWKFIENPFRKKSFMETSRVFILATCAMLLTLLVSGTIYANNGFPQRVPPPITSIRNDAEMNKWGNCLVVREVEIPQDLSLCHIGAESQEPTFLLWGDSHARALAPAINKSATDAGINGYISSITSCPPLLGIDRKDQYIGVCSKYNDMVLAYIEARPELDTIILTARWALSANGTRYKIEEGASITQVDLWSKQESANTALFQLGLQRTISKLRELNRNIVIVTGVPEVGYDVPSAYVIASQTGRDINSIIAPTMSEYQERNGVVLSTVNSIVSNNENVWVVNITDAMCDIEKCNVIAEEHLLYRDDDHLSTFGAYYISHLFAPIFNPNN